MSRQILPPLWRDAWREFNRDYLSTRADARRFFNQLFAAAIICAGFYLGAWMWGGR